MFRNTIDAEDSGLLRSYRNMSVWVTAPQRIAFIFVGQGVLEDLPHTADNSSWDSLALADEGVSYLGTSEIYNQGSGRNNPEDMNPYSQHCGNLESRTMYVFY